MTIMLLVTLKISNNVSIHNYLTTTTFKPYCCLPFGNRISGGASTPRFAPIV